METIPKTDASKSSISEHLEAPSTFGLLMNTSFNSSKFKAVAAWTLLATAIVLSFSPARAGLFRMAKNTGTSFVVYSVGHDEQSIDDTEHGFSAIFIDALIAAEPNEDVAVTIRRAKANLENDSTPVVADFINGTASLKNTHSVKKAFVVAVEKYETRTLTSPVHDARRLEKALQDIGYETESITNPDRNAFASQLHEFTKRLKEGDQVLFYFSGRGFDLSTVAHIVLRGAETPLGPENDLQSAVSFEKVRDKVTEKARNAIFILDIDRTELFGARSAPTAR